jgi:hypothetical protein
LWKIGTLGLGLDPERLAVGRPDLHDVLVVVPVHAVEVGVGDVPGTLVVQDQRFGRGLLVEHPPSMKATPAP